MNITDLMSHVQLPTRLVLEGGVLQGRPCKLSLCGKNLNAKEENKRVWGAVKEVFKKAFGKQACKRMMAELFKGEKERIKLGCRSLFTRDVRLMLSEAQEVRMQDVNALFRELKMGIFNDFQSSGGARQQLKLEYFPNPAKLESLKGAMAEGLKEELRHTELIENVGRGLWDFFHSALTEERNQLGNIQGSSEKIKTSSGGFMERITPLQGLPLRFQSRSLREADAEGRIKLLELPAVLSSSRNYHYALAKAIAYREMDPGHLIKSPEGYYEVYSKVVKGGMVAYALKTATAAMNLPPIILFRGTLTALAGLHSLDSILTDIDPTIGQTAYYVGKEKLKELLNDPRFMGSEGTTVCLLGHSLGGVLAQYLVADLASGAISSKVTKVNYFITNTAAAPLQMADSFAKSMKAGNKDITVSGTLIRESNDPINSAGERFLGHDCKESSRFSIECLSVDTDIGDPHCSLVLLDKETRCRVIESEGLDNFLDNTHNPKQRILEFFRRYIARPLIYLFIWPIHQLYLYFFGKRPIQEYKNQSENLTFSQWQQQQQRA